MAENIEPITDDTEAAEVEAHGSVLDLQTLGKDAGKSENSCISLVSANAEL